MAKPCDICGDPGVIEAIIICCECKVAREHLYCMRVVRTEAPPFWRCEECEQKKSVSTGKTVEVKMKTQKVLVLMEKTTRVTSPSKNVFATRFNFKERSVVTGRTKYISCAEAVKLSSGSTNTLKNPNRRANERKLKTANTEFLPKSPRKPEKPDTKKGSKFHDNVEAGSSAHDQPSLTSALCVTKNHNLSTPAFRSYWKGSFYLPNGHENFNDAFKAHPPMRVPHEVYETLLKMPENIYFELVPNHQVCTEIYSGYCPDNDDIGLYFFPRFKNRLENNISMIEFLWRENFVMKSIVNGVELLVFSSRLLQPNSQEFQGNYFLWGVFCCPKTKVVADSRPLLEAKHEPCDDAPLGFKKIFKPCVDAPPGFENVRKPQG